MRPRWLVMATLAALLGGCAGACEPTNVLVPAARTVFEIAWNEPEARAGVIEAGFDPEELPLSYPDPSSSVYASNGAVTLISRRTALGSELIVTFVGQGERSLSEQELEDAQTRAERDLEGTLLSLVGAFEEGSTWTRAAPPTWDHAVSRDDCG